MHLKNCAHFRAHPLHRWDVKSFYATFLNY
jgi:hypothetical protein